MIGTIKKLTDKNFGFIAPEEGEKDFFFHANNVADNGFASLNEGDKVEFEIIESQKGPAADKVKKI